MSDKPTGIVNIRGKDYRTVALRVRDFRDEFSGWTIETNIVTVDDKTVIMRAEIRDREGIIIGTGHAEEMRGRGINATSAL